MTLARAPRQLDIVDDTALRGDVARKHHASTDAKTVCDAIVHHASSTDCALSTSGEKHHASSTVSAIDRRRIALKVSNARLCALAGVEPNNWRKLRRGAQRASPATLRKLEAALAQPRQAKPPQVIAAFQRVCTQLVAAALGADVAAVLATDFTVQRGQSPAWLAAARVRMIATYITAVELQVENAELARALGISRQAIKKLRDKVEDLRDDAAIDAAIEMVTRQVRG